MSKVAILGYGVVGTGVDEVLASNAETITARTGQTVQLKYILDIRDFPGHPSAALFVKDFAVIERDAEVDVVVETIGGVTFALDFTRRALQAGKSVVTSNKELVAQHGVELQDLARKHGVNYLFEASVGGGIPIIRPLRQCLTANRLQSVCGILNGTTNYMLTKMSTQGLSFDKALAEAQQNGYAEADPSADIDGVDAGRKLAILATLAFGSEIRPDGIPTEGIRAVTAADVAYARTAGYAVKLLARAVRQDDCINTVVAPHFVPESSVLYPVSDVFNAISICGDAIGEVMFYGRGAGKLPTASAVVADVIDAARHRDNRRFLGVLPNGTIKTGGLDAYSWFVRLEKSDLTAFPNTRLLVRSDAPAGEIGLITTPMSRAALLEAVGQSGGKLLSAVRVLE